jgi:hypothetical protein
MVQVVRRIGRCLVVAVGAATVSVGCAQTVTGSAQRAAGAAPGADRSYAYSDDRCGLLDDSTIQQTVVADEVTRPFSGAVCQYILTRRSGPAAGTVDVTFSWFESGSLARERDVAEQRGATIADFVLERHSAFTARRDVTGAACSATAAAGTGVLSWWVQFRGQRTGDPCPDAEKLLSATLRSEM